MRRLFNPFTSNDNKKVIQFSHGQFRWIMEHNYLNIFHTKYSDRVQILPCEKRNQILLIGDSLLLAKMHVEIRTLLMEISRSNLQELNVRIRQFLIKLKMKDSLQSFVNSKFKANGIEAVLVLNGEQSSITALKHHLKHAVETVSQTVVIDDTLQLNDSQHTDLDEWKSLREMLTKDGLLHIDIKSNVISLAGVKSKVEEAKAKILGNFEDGLQYTKILRTTYGRAKCLLNEFSLEHENVSVGMTCEKGGGIYIKGPKKSVKNVCIQLHSEIENISTCNKELTPHMVQEFLDDEEGLIQRVEDQFKCLVLPDGKSWSDDVIRQSQDYPCLLFCKPAISKSFSPILVTVEEGDITKEQSDAIVNSVGQLFDLSQGQVSQAILSKAGPHLQKEVLAAYGDLIRVTNGGALPCKKILHAVTPDQVEMIGDCLMRILEKAEEQHCTSLSIPAIGTGNLRLPSIQIAKIFKEFLTKFCHQHSTSQSLCEVNVVIANRQRLKVFQQVIMQDSEKETGPDQDDEGNEKKVKIHLYARKKASIEKAWQYISSEVEKMYSKLTIKHEAIRRLSDWEICEVEEIASINKIKAIIERDIILQGMQSRMNNAKNKIVTVLDQFVHAETCSEYVKWQWLNESKMWTSFHIQVNYLLEKKRKHTNNSSVAISNSFGLPCLEKNDFIIVEFDLREMMVKKEGKEFPIRRKLHEGEDGVPDHWEHMHQVTAKRVVLDETSDEYIKIKKRFLSSMQVHAKITKIERIQNESLYKQYTAKKKEVALRLKRNKCDKVVERQLFHGTTAAEQIITHGFDRSFAGKNATKYGRGVYFAKHSNYSHSYALPDSCGKRQMFLADVITGDYCEGHEEMKALPSTANNTYDSAVNNIRNPSIFVVFKDASVYPTYLISYTTHCTA